MFKAVNNLREQKGFTLIELLIVIAIIGILAAIAIPAFLGQRDKARQRSVEASARGALSEVQATIDDGNAGMAMIFLTDPNTMTCYDPNSAVFGDQFRNSCANLYSDIASVQTYASVSQLMTAIQTHHNVGKTESSPYDGSDLVVNVGPCTGVDYTAAAQQGHVVMCMDAAGRTGKIIAISDVGAEIYNTPISAR